MVDLQRMAYPHKWSPISCKSSAGQRKDTGQRPMLYRWTTQPTEFEDAGISHSREVPKSKTQSINGVIWSRPSRRHSSLSAMSPFDRADDFLFAFHRNYVSILYCFRDIAKYLSKFANFCYLIWGDSIRISLRPSVTVN